MQANNLEHLIAMILYMAAVIGIGIFFAKRANKNSEAYFLGGRTLGPWVSAFSAEASDMVDAKADWLYNLPEWDKIFTPERKHELYLEQKKSGTIVKPKKIGRNDPCPCGSGKKYKYCCGRNK